MIKIQDRNTDAIDLTADEVYDKVTEDPVDDKPHSSAQEYRDWHEVEGGNGEVEDAPSRW